jgi:hypothetical protein
MEVNMSAVAEYQEPLGALSIERFCDEYDICRGTFHKLQRTGKGPKIMKVGTRTLITRSAALEWERKMLAETEAAEGVCHAA